MAKLDPRKNISKPPEVSSDRKLVSIDDVEIVRILIGLEDQIFDGVTAGMNLDDPLAVMQRRVAIDDAACKSSPSVALVSALTLAALCDLSEDLRAEALTALSTVKPELARVISECALEYEDSVVQRAAEEVVENGIGATLDTALHAEIHGIVRSRIKENQVPKLLALYGSHPDLAIPLICAITKDERTEARVLALLALEKIDLPLAKLFSESALIDSEKEVRQAARFIQTKK